MPTPSNRIVPEGTYKIAEQLVQSGQFENAKQLCRMILEANPSHALTLLLLGTILVNSKKLLEAEQLVLQAAKLYPHSYKINSTLAYIYRLLNKTELADMYAKNAAQGRIYTDWIKQFDTLKEETIHTMQVQLQQWHNPPIISIIISIFNANVEWLRNTIDSVVNQIYPHWELCIIDNASTLPHIRLILENYAQQNIRIKIHFRSINEDIAITFNDGLALATGNYVAILNQDDVLAIHALYFVAAVIISNPSVMLIYSDEDMLNELDERIFPYLKCDWNPDLFLSHNFVSHLSVFKTNLLQELGGFRNYYAEACQYDLILRVIECIEFKHIQHIPHILYHKRIQRISDNMQMVGVKPNACTAVEMVISEYLQRQNKTAQVIESYNIPGTFRIQYSLPNILPLVSIIIPTNNKLELLRVCVGSILTKTNYANFEIIIIDNQCNDIDTLEYLESLQLKSLAHILKYPHPFNYSAINNFAVTHAKGELICLLNNDVEVINESWLTEMVSHAIRPEVGAVGSKLWYSDNTLQHAGVIVGIYGVAGHAHKRLARNESGYFGKPYLIQNVSAVTGACIVMRKEVFNTVGGLNDTDLTVAYSDIDLCLKITSLGLRIVWTPFAELYHDESSSRGREDTVEKQARYAKEIAYMQQHWNSRSFYDPAYNPNLTLETTNFALAWPPRVQINELHTIY